MRSTQEIKREMKFVAFAYTLVVLWHSAFGWTFTDSRIKRKEVLTEDIRLLDIFKTVKRSSMDFCGLFNEWCVPSSNQFGSACCPSYVCKCNLWSTNCRCSVRIGK